MKFTKTNYLFLFLLIFSFLSFSFTITHQQPSDTIVGKWKEESGVRTIEIYKEGDAYFGKILTNKHQDDDQLKPGIVLMDGFKYDEDNDYWKGKIIIPSRDMVLSGKIISKSKDQIKSTARIAFISKSKIWNRIK